MARPSGAAATQPPGSPAPTERAPLVDDSREAGDDDGDAAGAEPAAGGRYPTWMRLFMFCVFWSCTAFSIVLPSLAPYLTRMGADPMFLGWTVAVFCFGEMIGALFFGYLYNVANDRWPKMGPTHVLASSIMCGVVGSVLYVAADSAPSPLCPLPARSPLAPSRQPYSLRAAAAALVSPLTCFLGRFLTGLWTGGKQAVEQAYMAERAPPSQLTEYTADLGT